MAEGTSKTEFYMGVDLGGTKILAGVFADNLKCLGKTKLSTKAERGEEAVIDRVARCIREAVDERGLELSRCRGVGIGAPGAVDYDAGRVVFAPNLGWKDLPLKKELEKRLRVPVFLENDCNVCTLGVFEKELGGKPHSVIGMFVGTGIGGGMILNGELYSGFRHTAGEIGHMVVLADGPKCGCGRNGCLEALGSRTAITKQIRRALKEGAQSVLTDILKKDTSTIRSGDLRKAIKRGDKLTGKVVQKASYYIGIGVANLVNILNPEYFVLGGGVVDALEGEMLKPICEVARQYVFPGAERGLRIVCTALGDDAGITGAAVLARRARK